MQVYMKVADKMVYTYMFSIIIFSQRIKKQRYCTLLVHNFSKY